MSKILIVEDNEMNRDMLSRRLERKGFDVVMAEDGKKGVDMSKSETPDLILMDLSLPIMDGWEATSTIKSEESTRDIQFEELERSLPLPKSYMWVESRSCSSNRDMRVLSNSDIYHDHPKAWVLDARESCLEFGLHPAACDLPGSTWIMATA